MPPQPPPELSHFAFLIGNYRCEARVLTPAGNWQTFPATWSGHYILDRHVIADEYRMTTPSGDLIVLGLNFRVYDHASRTWNIKWLNALTGAWLDLGSSELGGITIDDDGSITYAFREPMAAHAYTRATYTNITPTHFTWRGEQSPDASTWSPFMIVEADRVP